MEGGRQRMEGIPGTLLLEELLARDLSTERCQEQLFVVKSLAHLFPALHYHHTSIQVCLCPGNHLSQLVTLSTAYLLYSSL